MTLTGATAHMKDARPLEQLIAAGDPLPCCPDCKRAFVSRLQCATPTADGFVCSNCFERRHDAALASGQAQPVMVRRTWKDVAKNSRRRDEYAVFDEEAFERDWARREDAARAGKPPPDDRAKGWDHIYDDAQKPDREEAAAQERRAEAWRHERERENTDDEELPR